LGKIRSSQLPKSLRKRQSDAEEKLWFNLRNRHLTGFKFRRQHRIGRYVVDLVCLERKLVIEVDGGQHNESPINIQDTQRTIWLEKEGYRVVRFWDNDVLNNTDGVLETIRIILDDAHPHPDPLPSRERGV
jgi:very-short-patch-repair endonuclease